MSESSAIRCDGVTKVYELAGRKIEALKGVNFEVKHGQLVSIMGPSGSGKSTLLHVIGTLDRPTSGKVYIDGTDVTEFDEAKLSQIRSQKIGFVFQFFNLATHLTAIENVSLPMLLCKKYNDREARERAKLLLELVGLPKERFGNKPSQLSGGQQQMVAMARALSNDPSFILADEPTGNLDLESSVRLISLIKFINSSIGQTFIIVTHNPEVAAVAPQIKFMRGGELFDKPPESFLMARISGQDLISSSERMNLFESLFDLEERAIKRKYIEGEIREEELINSLERIEFMRRKLN